MESDTTTAAIGRQKKVKHIINGYQANWGGLEELTIIIDNEDRVIYSGDTNQFLNPTDIYLLMESKRLKELDAIRVLTFNRSKLFIFV